MEIYDVVRKLVGEIQPIGESNEDQKRYSNLEVLGDLVDKLIQDIDLVANGYEDRYEYSMKQASDLAKRIKNELHIN